MMKNSQYLYIIALLFLTLSCKKTIEEQSEIIPHSFNFKNLQKEFSLYKTGYIYEDTASVKTTLFYKNYKEIPNNAFLIVENKSNDTILKYFGDYQKLRDCFVFKRRNNYFIQFNSNYTQSPRQLSATKFFKIDTVKQTFVDVVQDLSQEPFQRLFLEKVKDSVNFNLLYKKIPSNDFQIIADYYMDTLDFKIKYESVANLEFIELNDSIQLKVKPTIIEKSLITDDSGFAGKVTLDNSVGEIKGYDIVYDCYGCRGSSTDNIIVFAKKRQEKTQLISYYDFGGDYLDEISIRYFDGHPFIFIHSSHTYGHSMGNLYALDIDNLKVNLVNKIEPTIKIPDSIYTRNYYGVSIDKNDNFYFGSSLRSDNVSGEYSLSGKYNLIKVKDNIYLLEPFDVKLNLNRNY